MRADAPLIDLSVFTYRPFTFSVLVIVLIQFVCLGLGFLIPNYAQLVNSQDAFLAGSLLLPGCLAGAVLSPVSGRLLDRFGAEKPILSGNLCVIVSLCCFSIFAGSLTAAVGTAVVSTIVASAQTAMPDQLAEATRQGSTHAFWLLFALSIVMILCSAGAFLTARRQSAS
ncbi:MFS transporter [Ruminococcus sp. CLA-AA-H200]|uniref:MFS transporter n=2 Tax=Ruminococcus turbiniformis TaxID=2881258 RepID=A0ABS8FY67_9FIRM|nr:MFS transporter [Ruminococcus turbiniformis]MCC2254997.1 MFS transporter [Ruminococcus turbiniformis]